MQVFVKDYDAEGLDIYKKVLLDLGQDPYQEHRLPVVVEGGLESPYIFGENLRRALLEDGLHPVYLTRGIYWCAGDSGIVSFCQSSISSSSDGVGSIPEGSHVFDFGGEND
jgi:hypothetical protein